MSKHVAYSSRSLEFALYIYMYGYMLIMTIFYEYRKGKSIVMLVTE